MKPKASITFVAFLVAFSAGLIILVWRGRAPPFDDSDLKPLRVELDPGSNSFFALKATGSQIRWVEPEKAPQLAGMAEGNPKWEWNEALAEQLLSQNQAPMEALAGSSLEHKLQVPAPKNFDDDYSYVSDWNKIALLESLRSVVLYRDGREREAFDLALKIVELGSRIEDCGGVTFHYRKGASIKMMGLRRMMQMSFKTSLPAQELVQLTRRLDGFRANEAALTNTFEAEYQVSARFVEELSRGRVSGTNILGPFRGMRTPMLNVSKTKRLFAESARVGIKSIPLSYAAMPLSELPTLPTNSSPTSPVSAILRGNAFGELMYDLMSTPPRSLLTRKCEENVVVGATQAALALRAYLAQHAELPGSLSDLVPGYLAALPLDDFDGKPLRYSREKKIIYSVGWNTIDDGGVERTDKERLDMVFKLEF